MHDRTVALPSRPVDVFVAARGVADGTSEPMIAIGFGKDLAGSEFFAVSISDARRLHRLLGQALIAPAPVPRKGGNDDAHL